MADKTSTHIVVNMLNDFISGPMACVNAENAMARSIAYINAHPYDVVLYAGDSHPLKHCSFITQGGEWPVHAVKNTRGQEIALSYYTKFTETSLRPNRTRIFEKGRNPEVEEHSVFNAVNSNGQSLCDVISNNVVISGLATEQDILATVKDLREAGKEVTVLVDALGYMNLKDHKNAIEEMKQHGAKILQTNK